MGDIVIQLDAADAPQTVANFVKLAQSGFYDGVKFHRVIAGFMDQAGDPLTKDDSQEAAWGTGGPGYTIPDENLNAHNGVGVVSMANTGQPNSGGSQFFINAVDNGFLDGKYSVFGKVISGMDVVTAINNTPVDSSDRPLTPVVINSVTLQ
jgi:cyclophilin family peptidyl-prolyl cis-trans isomerase